MQKVLSKNKIRKISVADQVFDQLKQLILDGTFKIGDKLPSEAELADTFGVNRLTIRLATQRLCSAGVLEVRLGNGTYVKNFSLTDSLYDAREFLFTKDRMDEMKHLREILEIECCALAIEKASNEEIHQLRQYADAFWECRNRLIFNRDAVQASDYEDILNVDIAYHRHLYLMSKNTLFYELFTLMQDSIRQNLKEHLTTRLLQEANRKTDNHLVICEAIEARDFEKCRQTYPLLLGRQSRQA